MDAGNIEISEIINAEPKWQCKSCLNHRNPGVIYCVCGRLMTTDSAENRKYISAILDTFSIPNFYIRKDRPRGHRYGKAPGCKEYHTANQLAKKCRKREYESIHDRYIRDRAFRKAWRALITRYAPNTAPRVQSLMSAILNAKTFPSSHWTNGKRTFACGNRFLETVSTCQ